MFIALNEAFRIMNILQPSDHNLTSLSIDYTVRSPA